MANQKEKTVPDAVVQEIANKEYAVILAAQELYDAKKAQNNTWANSDEGKNLKAAIDDGLESFSDARAMQTESRQESAKQNSRVNASNIGHNAFDLYSGLTQPSFAQGVYQAITPDFLKGTGSQESAAVLKAERDLAQAQTALHQSMDKHFGTTLSDRSLAIAGQDIIDIGLWARDIAAPFARIFTDDLSSMYQGKPTPNPKDFLGDREGLTGIGRGLLDLLEGKKSTLATLGSIGKHVAGIGLDLAIMVVKIPSRTLETVARAAALPVVAAYKGASAVLRVGLKGARALAVVANRTRIAAMKAITLGGYDKENIIAPNADFGLRSYGVTPEQNKNATLQIRRVASRAKQQAEADARAANEAAKAETSRLTEDSLKAHNAEHENLSNEQETETASVTDTYDDNPVDLNMNDPNNIDEEVEEMLEEDEPEEGIASAPKAPRDDENELESETVLDEPTDNAAAEASPQKTEAEAAAQIQSPPSPAAKAAQENVFKAKDKLNKAEKYLQYHLNNSNAYADNYYRNVSHTKGMNFPSLEESFASATSFYQKNIVQAQSELAKATQELEAAAEVSPIPTTPLSSDLNERVVLSNDKTRPHENQETQETLKKINQEQRREAQEEPAPLEENENRTNFNPS